MTKNIRLWSHVETHLLSGRFCCSYVLVDSWEMTKTGATSKLAFYTKKTKRCYGTDRVLVLLPTRQWKTLVNLPKILYDGMGRRTFTAIPYKKPTSYLLRLQRFTVDVVHCAGVKNRAAGTITLTTNENVHSSLLSNLSTLALDISYLTDMPCNKDAVSLSQLLQLPANVKLFCYQKQNTFWRLRLAEVDHMKHDLHISPDSLIVDI